VLVPGDCRRLVGQDAFRREIFPKMLAAARALAEATALPSADSARQHAATTLDAEISRLEDLATRNPRVSPDEIAALHAARAETLTALGAPRLRLDALRLVWRA
jgi:ATP-dependent helicase HepA